MCNTVYCGLINININTDVQENVQIGCTGYVHRSCFHLIHYADDFRSVNWLIKLILLLLRQANNMISYCHNTR